ncbi:MAG: hypothetical protein AMQ74_01769 [Candidatus Methanofastidiosum methylothiophilum]|uniref:Uncharacterized protein n=1 Tax=Candidatus Methanofastidiosum methylothiophilum TaxID=1705564 RepID=A0A150IP68_9EURY|nr:MAG: hypothetical protein AMQ74_01769 [Candidatus Methanofastidiosum methylthiophilus]
MNFFVILSLGKIEVVAPSSVPMFVIVALSGTDRPLIPFPVNSNILFTPPLTDKSLKSSKITSFAEVQSESSPSRHTSIMSGIFK